MTASVKARSFGVFLVWFVSFWLPLIGPIDVVSNRCGPFESGCFAGNPALGLQGKDLPAMNRLAFQFVPDERGLVWG